MTKFLKSSKEFAGWWQLSIIPALFFAVEYGNVFYYALAAVMFAVYTILGHHVALHRYFTHAQFEASRVSEWVMALLGCVGSGFSPAAYVIAHSVHHRNSDTMKDVHGPQFGIKSLLFFYHNDVSPYVGQVARIKRVREVIKRYKWVNSYFKPLIFLWAALLCSISFELMLFFWWLPSCMTLWSNALGVYLQHDEDGPIKSNWYGLINLGEIYHDTHHENPKLYNTAPKGHIDTTHLAARFFFEK